MTEAQYLAAIKNLHPFEEADPSHSVTVSKMELTIKRLLDVIEKHERGVDDWKTIIARQAETIEIYKVGTAELMTMNAELIAAIKKDSADTSLPSDSIDEAEGGASCQ
jgi:hypothetical protein